MELVGDKLFRSNDTEGNISCQLVAKGVVIWFRMASVTDNPMNAVDRIARDRLIKELYEIIAPFPCLCTPSSQLSGTSA